MVAVAKAAALTGGRAVVEALKAEGVDTVFGIPGKHNLCVYDVLLDTPQIRNIVTRNEQGAAFMADGYARVTGKVGVCLVTAGPGTGNTIAAMGTAYADSIPILNITTEIPAHFIGKTKGVLHESRDQSGLLDAATGWHKRVSSVGEIPQAIHEAMRVLKTQRPRPAAIEIPADLIDAEGEAQILPAEEYQKPSPSPHDVAQIARLLAEAKRPLIWAGGGVARSGASAELRELAELLQAPVFTTNIAKGVFAADHRLALGHVIPHPLVRKFIAESDVMLALGTRFAARATGDWSVNFPKTLIHVDIDPSRFGVNYEPTMGVVSDAKNFLAAVVAELRGSKLGRRQSPVAEIKALKQAVLAARAKKGPSDLSVIQAVRRALPRDGIVVSDCAIGTQWMRLALDMYEPNTWVFPAGYQTLGYGYPAAVGAKAGRPDRPVVAFCGDAGFMMTGQELATAVQFGINFPVVIFNDQGYGTIRKAQDKDFGGRHCAVDVPTPDFALLARAYGAKSYRPDSPEKLGRAIKQAIRLDGPSIIDFRYEFEEP